MQGSITAGAVRGHASGVLFMAFFGTLWASIGAGGLGSWGMPWIPLGVILIGVALLVGGITLWRSAGQLPADEPPSGGAGNPMGRAFWLIFATEGIAIAIASVVCNALGRFDLFFSIMAIIVGLHFLPLARLFAVSAYYAVGALLCLIGIVGIVVVPVEGRLGAQPIEARSLFVGVGCAVILWGVGVYLWLRGTNLVRTAAPSAR